MFWGWLIVAYCSGALPWSVWLGRWLFQTDPRHQPDGNPGAANAWRAAGWQLGVSVLVLDFAKAAVPVALAHWVARFPGSQLFWIALMPTLGHAFSIFLGLRGGRALVVLFGVWTALTLYAAPLVMGLTACASLVVTRRDILRTLAIPVVLIAYLLLVRSPGWMLALAAAELGVMTAKIAIFQMRVRASLTGGSA
jgi:acyl-phosphate glycerol 3-phosphate acyltransferase